MTIAAAVDQDEVALLGRIARRDPEGISVLYDRYAGVAFAVAYRLLADRGAADDAVQGAFLNVWRAAATYDAARGTARTWLLTIVHRQAIDALRARRARGGATVDIDAMLSLGGDQDTAAQVIASLEAERVRAALAILSPEQRQVIDLAYFGGLSQTEIAARVAIPLGTVKGRMRLGLEKLRGALGPMESFGD